jgi:hypothetical protein
MTTHIGLPPLTNDNDLQIPLTLKVTTEGQLATIMFMFGSFMDACHKHCDKDPRIMQAMARLQPIMSQLIEENETWFHIRQKAMKADRTFSVPDMEGDA